jgi:hypothetical protein
MKQEPVHDEAQVTELLMMTCGSVKKVPLADIMDAIKVGISLNKIYKQITYVTFIKINISVI